jgi:hypothetical protein
MKQVIIMQGGWVRGRVTIHTYLRIQIVDLSDSGTDVTSMNGPSYLDTRLDRLLFSR